MLSDSEVIKLYRSGLGMPSVASQSGHTTNHVTFILKKHGVSPRTKSEAAFLRHGHVEPLDPIFILQEYKKGKTICHKA